MHFKEKIINECLHLLERDDVQIQLKQIIMGKMKELFISMQEGLMQGIAITNAQRERQLDDEHQMSVSKKVKAKKKTNESKQ